MTPAVIISYLVMWTKCEIHSSHAEVLFESVLHCCVCIAVEHQLSEKYLL